MIAEPTNTAQKRASRRAFLKTLGGIVGLAFYAKDLMIARIGTAQTSAPGAPLPDEAVEATLKRLFGNRSVLRGEDKMKLELPQIAEDGGNVAITIDSSLPLSGAVHLNNLYIIADKNRRPLLTKFAFTPEAGRAFVSTSIRLATTTDVRAVAEMNDGTLYSVTKHVRVTISGCDLPPQG